MAEFEGYTTHRQRLIANDCGHSTMSSPEIPKDLIDADTFNQILEMDDEGDREFSREIVLEFVAQAESTFADIESQLYEIFKTSNLFNVVLIFSSKSQKPR